MEEPSRKVSNRAPIAVATSFNKEVDEVVADRVIRRHGISSYLDYFIKWKGLPDTEASRESGDALWQYNDLMQRYKEDAMRSFQA